MGCSKLGKSSPGGYAELPVELIRKIYDVASYLTERLRGLAVCKSWQRALQDLPFEWLALPSTNHVATSKRQCLWVIARRPAFRNLNLGWGAGYWQRFVQAILHSVQRETVESLRLYFECETLPYPAIFPNLTALQLNEFVWDADWLAYLSQLPKLQSLRLSCRTLEPEEVPSEPALLEPPALLALSSLDLHVPHYATVRIVLWPLLPALQKLLVTGTADIEILCPARTQAAGAGGLTAEGPAVVGGASTAAALAASQPVQATPCALTSLSLNGSSVTIDFSGLPALRHLMLDRCIEVAGASTLSGATALQVLYLEGSSGHNSAPLTADWVSELLQAAPASLRHLELEGEWGWEQGQLIGGLSQLQMLGLTAGSPGGPDGFPVQDRLPPADAAVWGSLKACRWSCEATLPEALRQSTQLELLSFKTTIPTMLELDLLEALPALRRLCVDTQEGGFYDDADADCWHIYAVISRRLPNLQQLEMKDNMDFWSDHVVAVLGM